MKFRNRRELPAVAAVFAAGLFAFLPPAVLAEQRSLSQDWRFQKGDSSEAQRPAFNDGDWVKVSVPHDFSIMDKPDGSPPFDAQAIAGQDSGYLPGGIGWYRRDLNLSNADAVKIVKLHFEAVYMDAEIWLNGQSVAKHAYGYTAFTVDLTGKVRPGKNVISIRVNHPDPSSRWYAGSGIIRPVSLEVQNCVHIDADDVFVTTPEATTDTGIVAVETAASNCANNAQTVELLNTVVSSTGEVVAQARQKVAVPGRSSTVNSAKLTVERPALWSPEHPNLYTLVQELNVNGATVDTRRTRFGIRAIAIDATNGLRINGKPYELRGGNIHHDNYMLGGAGLPDADRRKVALMKAAGYNAIRNAHNPASQATLEAADELGILVINEAFDAWNRSKRDKDYSRFFADDWATDIDSLVVSGRNHPSVIMWSIGNEIPEDGSAEGLATGRQLAERVRRLDPTRAVTQGINADPPRSTAQAGLLDVAGLNYKPNGFEIEHAAAPNLVMYTSESLPQEAFLHWSKVESLPYVIGDFVWTAVDYLGESAIGWMGYSQDWQKLGPYPWHLAYCGEIDATGRKRPAAYYRQVLWKTGITPVAAFVRQPKGTADLPDRDYFPTTPPHLDWSLDDIHPSWTWPGQEGKSQEVVVYSELPEVEVFLNGKSLGRQRVDSSTAYKTSYQVPYQSGRLVAVGYQNGKEAGRWELRTAGPPASARVSVDRSKVAANGQDLAYITIELFDANGTPVYARHDERKVKVRVSGAGRLAGIGNGNPQDPSSLQSGDRMTFHGRVLAVVQANTSPGEVVVDVEVDGLPSQSVRIDAIS